MKLINIINNFQQAAWHDKNLELLSDFVAENVVLHSSQKETKGLDALKSIFSEWISAFPDLKVYFYDVYASGDKIVSQWNAEGTHSGVFKNINPTDKKVKYSGCTIYKVKDNKIVEYWSYVNVDAILEQIN